MILRTKGISFNVNSGVVKRITRHRRNMDDLNNVLISDITEYFNNKYITLTTHSKFNESSDVKLIHGVKESSHLFEGDLVHIGNDGNIRTLYRINSEHNFLLVTERCNSNCLMCSQPPKDKDDIEFLHNVHKLLIPLIPKSCREICITGGEPTILGDIFFDLLDLIKTELPRAEVHVLTNGRNFSIDALAKKLSDLNFPRLMLGIPLFSDDYKIHDYVVQTKDAFFQTVMGIQNLKRYGIRIEIRVVLHKITIPRLYKLMEYVYKNLPYVDQVVLMGLEITGYTLANLNALWIDPSDYDEELSKAAHYLDSKGIKVSIYNTPLCLLSQNSWRFTKKSISDWKNVYFDECRKCAMLEKCGGLFASSEKTHSKYIKAFNEEICEF